MVCLLAFDKETLDYWTRHSHYAAFVVDLASSWVKRRPRISWIEGLA